MPVGERHAFLGKTLFEKAVMVLLVLMLVSQTVCCVSVVLLVLVLNVLNSALCVCSLIGLGFNVPNSSLCV